MLERDGGGGVWDAKGVVHRAVNRVHHPAVFGGHVAGDAFLAEDGDLRKRGGQNFFDERLAAHVEFQLDVVGLGGVHALGLVPVSVHDFSSGAGGFHGGGQGDF